MKAFLPSLPSLQSLQSLGGKSKDQHWENKLDDHIFMFRNALHLLSQQRKNGDFALLYQLESIYEELIGKLEGYRKEATHIDNYPTPMSESLVQDIENGSFC